MRNYNNLFIWMIIILFIFGIGRVLIFRPLSILIPLIIFGAVFYFLKHPEKLARRNRGYKRTYSNKTKASKRKKDYPFQVINGNRNKDNYDDDRPKYH